MSSKKNGLSFRKELTYVVRSPSPVLASFLSFELALGVDPRVSHGGEERASANWYSLK
jgi:hypothetical protein